MREVDAAVVSPVEDVPVLKVNFLPQSNIQGHKLLKIRMAHRNIYLLRFVKLKQEFILVKDLLLYYF